MVRWIGEAVAPETAALVAALKGWDGDYGARSRGAAAYELVLSHLAHALFDADALAALAAGWRGRERLQAAIAAADDAQRDAALRSALIQAAEDFGQARDWGDLHRLVLRHPLALVPLISGFYRFADEAASGTSDTLNKTAHALVDGRHAATYGSTARYVCDLSDPDRNRFVLLGGQDGFLGSANFLDQLALWRDGRMIEVPLRLDSVRARFPYRTRIEPTHRTPP
jgi:penicillin amidase